MTTKTENPITQELVKSNVTEAVIANLRTKYLPLKINGIDDKEGYDAVHRARIECRDIRILAEKVCKKGREEAVKTQKEWLAKEKEVVGKVQEVELYLKKQEDAIDAEKEAIKIRQERLLKLPARKEQIVGIEDYVATDDLILRATANLMKEEPFDDAVLMTFDDVQWSQIILNSKSRKLDDQQKLIDEQRKKERDLRLATRTNILLGMNVKLNVTGRGIRIFVKGKHIVDENFIAEATEEQFLSEIALFEKEINEPEKQSTFTPRHFTAPSPTISERTDEEKLFYFGGVIENLTRPVMKTDEGKKVLAEAEALILQAITILRK